MASGSSKGGSGSRIRKSTAAKYRQPKYQSTNPRGDNYSPF